MDKVVHFEIPVDDITRAHKFYSTVFGWKMNPVPGMDYTIVHTVEIDEKHMPKEPGAINGGMMKRNEHIKSPVITINVENVDNAIENTKIHGGTLVMGKLQVGDMGYTAYIQDTEGNVIGLWQNLKK